jgi:hypothetical protein
MTITTSKSMNLLMEKNDVMISAKVPGRMKELIELAAVKHNMNFSQYMKLAIAERIEKDFPNN